MKNFNPIRGTYDYLPKVAAFREEVRQTILKSYQRNGYNLISTPILESLDFLDSSDGGDNLRLMYKTIKRGDKLDLTKENLTINDIVEEGLRYDLTVPLSRFYANNRETLPMPFKAIQIDSVFRAERPQKGRNRQFVQCDIDVFGDKSINAELELLKTCLDTYELLGFDHLTVRINHKEILNALLNTAGFKAEDYKTVCVTLDKIDKISITGVMMELMDKGFNPDNINKLVDIINDVMAGGLSVLTTHGVDEAYVADLEYLITNLNTLTNNKHDVRFDISIVRGQGYYTGTVYEVFADGFGGAIGGGGRYDKMIGKFSGVDCPAVGYSIGFECVTMLMQEKRKDDKGNNLALLYDNNDDIVEVFKIKAELMKQYNVSLYARPKNMKSFYDRIVSVANMVTSVADYKQGKEIKVL